MLREIREEGRKHLLTTVFSDQSKISTALDSMHSHLEVQCHQFVSTMRAIFFTSVDSELSTTTLAHLRGTLDHELNRWKRNISAHSESWKSFCGNHDVPSTAVNNLRLNISDTHGDFSVAELTTEWGVFYSKIRHPDGETIMRGYQSALLDNGLIPAFEVPAFWSSSFGTIHSGVHRFQGEPTESHAAVAGRLLAQMYFCRATDMIRENVVFGEDGRFYLIDCETVPAPVVDGVDRYTIFDVGILPKLVTIDGKSAFDASFLTSFISFAPEQQRAALLEAFFAAFSIEHAAISEKSTQLGRFFCDFFEYSKSFKSRIVLRPTQYYFNFARSTLYYNALRRSGDEPVKPPKMLGVPFDTTAAEAKALSQGNIPLCTMSSDGEVSIDGARIGSIEPPSIGANRHASAFRVEAEATIKATKHFLFQQSGSVRSRSIRGQASAIGSYLKAVDAAFWRERAARWSASLPQPGGFVMQAYNLGLYAGWSGAAIFLCAANASGMNRGQYPVEDIFEACNRRRIGEGSLASGVSGVDYANFICGQILSRTVTLPEPYEMNNISETSDFLKGYSGLAFSLARTRPNSEAHENARNRVVATTQQSRKVRLASLAHGTSGIILGLVGPSHRETQCESLVAEMMDIEDNARVSSGWRDLRGDGDGAIVKWCHGAVGIGISRMAILKGHFTSLRSRAEVDLGIAIDSIIHNEPLEWDYCCGAIGQADFLLEASLFLDDKSLLHAARARFAQGLEMMSSQPQKPGGSEHLNIGFMKGISGAGYVYLRMQNSNLPYLWA